MHIHEIEEMEYRTGPLLWDAGEGVCCAAYQLGACPHTEDASLWDQEDDVTEAELAELHGATFVARGVAFTATAEEPF